MKRLFLPDSDEEPSYNGGPMEPPPPEGVDLSGRSYMQNSVVDEKLVPMVRGQVALVF